MILLALVLLGAGGGVLIAGVSGRRSVSAEPGTVVDLHHRRLADGLLARLGSPALDRAARLARRATPASRAATLRQRLDNAGSLRGVEEHLSVKTITAGAGLLLALLWAFASDPSPARLVFGAAAGACLGFALPDIVLRRRGEERQRAIGLALPDALDLLALTVQAGLGLEQGIAEVTAELDGPLRDELDRMRKEQQLGRSRRDALEALHARNSSQDLRDFVEALLHAERLGASVGDTLKVQARELRRRRRARARELAGKAPVKLLFPLVFGIFPAMFVVILGPGAMRIAQALFTR